jgi:hypothetical protein
VEREKGEGEELGKANKEKGRGKKKEKEVI